MKLQDMFLEDASMLQDMGISLKENVQEEKASRFLLSPLAAFQGTGSSLTLHSKPCPAYGILYSASGSVSYDAPLSETHCTALSGTFLLFDCSVPYQLSFRFSGEYELLIWSGYSATYYSDRLLDQAPCTMVKSNDELLTPFRQLTKNISADPAVSHMHLTVFLTLLVLHSLPSAPVVPSYLQALKDTLDKEYNVAHSLETFELKYHVSRYSICRDFQKYYHSSPLQYLHQVRIRAAKELLQETNKKIQEISYEVGYENVNHFIHHFKKTAGVTPAEYRKHLSSYL